MKKTIILLISIVLIACSDSPEKLMEKGNEYLEKSAYKEAKAAFQEVIDIFPDDSLAVKAEYNIAWIDLDKKHKYESGYNQLKAIAERYPESETGIAAKEDIKDFPKWLLDTTNSLRSDTTNKEAMETLDFLINNFNDNSIIPEALYLKGNIYLNDLKEYYRAINTYQEVIYKYNGTNYEPMSKFMIGFIYANVLNDLPKAEKTYSEFMQEFPEHELVPSVKFELEYLGKKVKDIEDLKK